MGPPQPPMQQQQQQQQARRLDPDQMPSAIQVMEDDIKARSGDFLTNAKGELAITIRHICQHLLTNFF